MALTDNCSLFSSIHEDGINTIVQHIMRKRPSLFNYGTDKFLHADVKFCKEIQAAPEVIDRKNPLFKVEPPLSIIGLSGTGAGLNFCFQLVEAEVDLHPGGLFDLPAELEPPLAEQHFVIRGKVCGGIGCPDDEDAIYYTSVDGLATLPFQLNCFCLDLFALCHFEVIGPKGAQTLVARLDSLEIIDIEPDGLEASMECYLRIFIKMVILPKLQVGLEKLVFDIGKLATISLSASPISAGIPNNPAVEDDKLKLFIDMEVTP